MPSVKGTPLEAEEQERLFKWAEYSSGRWPQLKNLYAVPNGGRRDRVEAAHLKRQGVKPGVPDICLAYPSGVYHGLYIEMKVGRNKPSDNQKKWIANLKTAGYMVEVCYGFEQAKNVIEKYLKL